MNDEEFRQKLREVDERSPSVDFVLKLRQVLEQEVRTMSELRLKEGQVTMIDVDDEQTPKTKLGPRGRLLAIGFAATLLVVAILAVQATRGGDRVSIEQTPATAAEISTTSIPATSATIASSTSTIPQSDLTAVGDAWVQSIVDNDRAKFVAMHSPDLQVDNTVIGWAGITGTLDGETIESLYFDGFDALQASLRADDDTIRADGCIYFQESGNVQCEYTASILGGSETRTMRANMGIAEGLIERIAFTGVGSEPPRIMGFIRPFLNDSDVAKDHDCLAIAFNSVECGEHESDVFRRFLPEFEQR